MVNYKETCNPVVVEFDDEHRSTSKIETALSIAEDSNV